VGFSLQKKSLFLVFQLQIFPGCEGVQGIKNTLKAGENQRTD